MTRLKKIGPHPVDIQVGENIRRQRILCGFSQTKLATAMGLSFQQVQKYERGTNRASASKLVAISTILQCSIKQLFANIETPVEGSEITPTKVRRLSSLSNDLEALDPALFLALRHFVKALAHLQKERAA